MCSAAARKIRPLTRRRAASGSPVFSGARPRQRRTRDPEMINWVAWPATVTKTAAGNDTARLARRVDLGQEQWRGLRRGDRGIVCPVRH
jgi:hypothetical protein